MGSIYWDGNKWKSQFQGLLEFTHVNRVQHLLRVLRVEIADLEKWCGNIFSCLKFSAKYFNARTRCLGLVSISLQNIWYILNKTWLSESHFLSSVFRNCYLTLSDLCQIDWGGCFRILCVKFCDKILALQILRWLPRSLSINLIHQSQIFFLCLHNLWAQYDLDRIFLL